MSESCSNVCCCFVLASTTSQLTSLQEELSSKSEENHRLQQEVSKLLHKVKILETQIRQLNIEAEELSSALETAHECQTELSMELIEVKEKHNNLLVAFHEKQEECRQLAKRNSLEHFFPYTDSLAFELEQSSSGDSEAVQSVSNMDDNKSDDLNVFEYSGQCITPDSLLSADSFPSMSTAYNEHQQRNGVASGRLNEQLSASLRRSSNTSLSTLDSMPSTSAPTVIISKTIVKNSNMLTNKLRYLKPLEGSSILGQWRKLASPDLNNLLEDNDKYVSRIQVNLGAIAKANYEETVGKTKVATTSTSTSTIPRTIPSLMKMLVSNNFMTTCSVYTLTTTSLSQTRESVTNVTTTFDNVQPCTGRQLPHSTISTTPSQHHHDHVAVPFTLAWASKQLSKKRP